MKKQIGIRLGIELIKEIDRICAYFPQKRTRYIEDAIKLCLREDLKKLPKREVINTWGDDIEQMPLNPEYEEIKNANRGRNRQNS